VQRHGHGSGVLQQPLVEDALVRPVLVEDEEFVSLLGEPDPYVVV